MREMYGQDQPDALRALSLGALAEFCVHIENQCAPVAEQMINMALSGPQSEDVVVRRNSVYLVGAAIQFGGPKVAPAIPQVGHPGNLWPLPHLTIILPSCRFSPCCNAF